MANYSASAWTDDILLDLIRLEDDRAAFAELYDRYWEPLLNMAGKRVSSVELAEEIVQDVFVSLYIRRQTLTITSSLEAYLKTALKYQVYKVYRAQQIHENYVSAVIDESQIGPILPDVALEHKQLREQIYRASEKMPETCREVFLLSRFEQLSHKEIAEKLNISVAMVKKHITKAMNIIRAEFKDHQLDLLSICLFVYFRH